jgi:hypothetical protein
LPEANNRIELETGLKKADVGKYGEVVHYLI